MRAIGIEDLDPSYIQEFSKFLTDNNVKSVKPEELLVMGQAHLDVGNRCYGLNGPPPKALWRNILGVARALDALRQQTDADVEITSAFRTPQYNSCIGSASRSVQTLFQGVDIRPKNWTAGQVADFLRSIREAGVFEGGIGEYKSFVHVDARGTRADWSQ